MHRSVDRSVKSGQSIGRSRAAELLTERRKDLQEMLPVTGGHSYLTDTIKQLHARHVVRQPCQKLRKMNKVQPQ